MSKILPSKLTNFSIGIEICVTSGRQLLEQFKKAIKHGRWADSRAKKMKCYQQRKFKGSINKDDNEYHKYKSFYMLEDMLVMM